MQLKNKVAVLAAIGFFIILLLGIFGDSFSLALAAEKKIKVRAVERIPAEAPRFVAGEVLASFRSDLPEQAIEGLLKAFGARTKSVSHITGHRRIAVPPGMSEAAFVKHLKGRPEVAAVQLNHIVYAFGPSDPDYGLQWHILRLTGVSMSFLPGELYGGQSGNRIQWQRGDCCGHRYGAGLQAFLAVPQAPEWKDQQWKVALPSGVDLDLVNSDSEPNDDNGHGTHVSNTISQNTNNGLQGAGVANGAKIMPIKVLDASGSGEESALAEALHLAADNGADVVNMSLGFPAGTLATDLPLLAQAVTYAYSRGITIVAAAGNDAVAACSYPAAFPEVICVGSTKYDGNLPGIQTTAPTWNWWPPEGPIVPAQMICCVNFSVIRIFTMTRMQTDGPMASSRRPSVRTMCSMIGFTKARPWRLLMLPPSPL